MLGLLLILPASFASCLRSDPSRPTPGRALRAGGQLPTAGARFTAAPSPSAAASPSWRPPASRVAAALAVPGPVRDELAGRWPMVLGLSLAAVLICAVGVADDYRLLRGRYKLLGQVGRRRDRHGFGVVVRDIRLFGCQIDLGLLAVPVHRLPPARGDQLAEPAGRHGRAAGQRRGDHQPGAGGHGRPGGSLGRRRPRRWPWPGRCSASCATTCRRRRSSWATAAACSSGWWSASWPIESSLKAPATIALSAPVVLLTLPILDTTAAIIRRKLTGRSIYTTDRGHLHHCLLRRGFSTWRVLLLVSSFCLVTGVGVLASEAFNNEWIALLTGLAVVGVLIVTRLFGYAEVMLVKERLRVAGRLTVRPRRTEGRAREIEVRLQGSADWKELWNARDGQRRRAEPAAGAAGRERARPARGLPRPLGPRPRGGRGPQLWRAEIPLTSRGLAVGRLEIVGSPDDEPMWMKIAAITKALDGAADAMLRIRGRRGRLRPAGRGRGIPAWSRPTPSFSKRAIASGRLNRPANGRRVSPTAKRRQERSAIVTQHGEGSGRPWPKAAAATSRNLCLVFWRRKALVAAGTVVGLVIAALVYAQSTPVYQSPAQVLVVKKSSGADAPGGRRLARHLRGRLRDHPAASSSRVQLIVERAVKKRDLRIAAVVPGQGRPRRRRSGRACPPSARRTPRRRPEQHHQPDLQRPGRRGLPGGPRRDHRQLQGVPGREVPQRQRRHGDI